MKLEAINVGNTENDGTGDHLSLAAQKIAWNLYLIRLRLEFGISNKMGRFEYNHPGYYDGWRSDFIDINREFELIAHLLNKDDK